MRFLLIPVALASVLSSAQVDVVDGDTVTISGRRIRVANIDAPELHRSKCDAERRLAVVAKARMAALLAHGDVVVHPGDPKDGRLRDRYGRTLATISVAGKDVGEILVAEGLARRWDGRRHPWCE